MKLLSMRIVAVCFAVVLPLIVIANDSNNEQYTDMIKGNTDTEFTIIEYASFTCPHCATFHEEVLPYIMKNFVDTGKATFIYREVYFDAPGLWAGLLARCVSPEKYFGIVDLLYSKQDKWASGSSEKEILNGLFSIGRQVGMKDKRINDCLQNKKKSLKMIDAYLKNSKSDGITSTPSLVINGQLIEYTSFDDLKAKVDNIFD